MTTEDLSQTIPDIYEQDIQFIIDNINQEPIGFWRRSLVRLCISLFESETFLLKEKTLSYCKKNNISLNPETILALQGKKFTLGENGKLKEGYASVKLIDDIKFTFQQTKEIRKLFLALDFSDDGWKNLKETIKIRNRITHPKSLMEQKIKADEIKICMSGYNWFYKNFEHFRAQEIQNFQHQISIMDEKIYNLKSNHPLNTPTPGITGHPKK